MVESLEFIFPKEDEESVVFPRNLAEIVPDYDLIEAKITEDISFIVLICLEWLDEEDQITNT